MKNWIVNCRTLSVTTPPIGRCIGVLWVMLTALCALVNPARCTAQENSAPVKIVVNANQSTGPLETIWNNFGYDEPNYTYAPNGEKLLKKLAALSSRPVHIRAHNLFTSGDGTGSLKWGSTNVYTEDAEGKPIYSWTIVDRIFDTYHELGIKPLVEIGFMPEALSTHPEPYRHSFPKGTIYTGWAYPPKDYGKWGELVFQFVAHLRERYGEAETKSWRWEIWNEPDIEYWKGTQEEYFQLYDVSTAAILRALPGADVGGPDTTGPAAPRAAAFLKDFLEHCAHGKNFATGKTGSPLDFVSFHPKGTTKWVDGHVEMGLGRQLASIDAGFRIVASFPEYRETPVILGESDPEGCAACSARVYPQNGYRNNPQYAAYTAATMGAIYELAQSEKIRFAGAVTWAFEFEGQPYFEGFRALATNGIDKPIVNVFRMFGLLANERVMATSSSALTADAILKEGVRGQPDINVIAARKQNEVEILVWNYHDDDTPAAPAQLELEVNGLLGTARRANVEHFRIDDEHSDAFTAWKAMGSPETPSAEQCEQLERAGQLQLLNSPGFVTAKDGSADLEFTLPREAVSLVRISWE